MARILAQRKLCVTVLCGTNSPSHQLREANITVYRIHCLTKEDFKARVVKEFEAYNLHESIDIIEGPDYGADAYFIKKKFLHLKYIVRCHTPEYLIREYSDYYKQYNNNPFFQRLKKYVKKWITRNKYEAINNHDIEYLNMLTADLIISPSKALKEKLGKDWKIPAKKIICLPNPYIPSEEFLEIKYNFPHDRITFIGKLSILKGAIDLIEAIPLILAKRPKTKIRIVGADSFSPDPTLTMAEYLIKRNKRYSNNIEIYGKVDLAKIPGILKETDLVICNSLWENFPNVILESMSAGKPVIATRVGGIPELVVHKVTGILVRSKSPKKLASAIIQLLDHQDSAVQMGLEGRKSVLLQYNEDIIGKGIEIAYKQLYN